MNWVPEAEAAIRGDAFESELKRLRDLVQPDASHYAMFHTLASFAKGREFLTKNPNWLKELELENSEELRRCAGRRVAMLLIWSHAADRAGFGVQSVMRCNKRDCTEFLHSFAGEEVMARDEFWMLLCTPMLLMDDAFVRFVADHIPLTPSLPRLVKNSGWCCPASVFNLPVEDDDDPFFREILSGYAEDESSPNDAECIRQFVRASLSHIKSAIVARPPWRSDQADVDVGGAILYTAGKWIDDGVDLLCIDEGAVMRDVASWLIDSCPGGHENWEFERTGDKVECLGAHTELFEVEVCWRCAILYVFGHPVEMTMAAGERLGWFDGTRERTLNALTSGSYV